MFTDMLKQLECEISDNKSIRKVTLERIDANHEIVAYEVLNCENAPFIAIVGMPHGNEPIGFWYCLDFVRRGTYKLHKSNFLVIPILDYEVALLNEWIEREFSLEKFIFSNYINTIDTQLEFTYGKNMRICQKKFVDLYKNYNIKYTIFIHQVPTISGIYCYTNMAMDEQVVRKLQKIFLSGNIPLEESPQGINVKKYAKGIFGVFRRNNLGNNCLGDDYSCQEYFNDILCEKYIVLEIPFWATKGIEHFILKDSSRLKAQLSNIALHTVKIRDMIYKDVLSQHEKNCIYWLNESIRLDNIVLDILSQKESDLYSIDIYYILRHLIYKASYLSMSLKIDNSIIYRNTEGLIVDILGIIRKYGSLIDMRLVKYKEGYRYINQIVDLCEKLMIRGENNN